MRRKTGTATNSRLWNWLAVPGLPTADTPPVALPIFIPPDEVLPHNATDSEFPRCLPETGCLYQGCLAGPKAHRGSGKLLVPPAFGYNAGIGAKGNDDADHCDSRSEEHTSELQSPCNLVC